MMEFLCPNGHKIQCPAERAGMAAKCPRCGVMFRIPDPSAAGVGESSGVARAPAPGDSTASRRPPEAPAPPGDPPGAKRRDPQIEFLCPNGHRLHGAASLQGRPGECPECGSRFRIPTYSDIPEDEKAGSGIRVGPVDGSDGSGIMLQLVDTADEGAGEESEGGPPAAGHPLAAVFARLWAERPSGSAVEVHLTGGEILLPDWFAPALSRRGHGVFALKEAGGTHTLVVVPWDSVVTVQIRGIADLPHEMIG